MAEILLLMLHQQRKARPCASLSLVGHVFPLSGIVIFQVIALLLLLYIKVVRGGIRG